MKKLLLITVGVISITQAFANDAKTNNQHHVVVGTKVENKTMQNISDHFDASEKNICAQITLQPSTDGKVTFVWQKDGQETSKFSTNTKESARYRTHACTQHISNGNWNVDVIDDHGTTLSSAKFSIGSGHVEKKQDIVTEKVEEKKVEPTHIVQDPVHTEEKKAPEVLVNDSKPVEDIKTSKETTSQPDIATPQTLADAKTVKENDAPKAFETPKSNDTVLDEKKNVQPKTDQNVPNTSKPSVQNEPVNVQTQESNNTESTKK